MPDGSTYTAAAAAEPSKPEPPRTYREPYIREPAFCYALQGPDGWYVARVEQLPLPCAYTLRIWKAPNRTDILYQDTFFAWRGQLWDDEQGYPGFTALLGAAVRATTGSISDWSVMLRPLVLNEIIELDTEGELHARGGCFSSLL